LAKRRVVRRLPGGLAIYPRGFRARECERDSADHWATAAGTYQCPERPTNQERSDCPSRLQSLAVCVYS
jgi:hypothetical protein